jgi:hypothetical protein
MYFRTPLDEWPAQRRDLHQTMHSAHNRQTDIRTPCEIRTRNSSKRAAEDPHLRPRGQWDRPIYAQEVYKRIVLVV